MDVFIEWILEAPVAGIDLENIEDTNASDREDEYLRLRTLPPGDMEQAFRAIWPDLARKLTFRAGDAALNPELADVSVPEVGNIELTRTSTITLTVALPDDDAPLTIGWAPDLGALIVRQRTVENGYAAFLTPGQMSDPIPRSNAGQNGSDCTSWLCRFTGIFGN